MEHYSEPPPRPIEWKDLDKRKFYVWGPTVFFGVRLINHPATLIKTRLQVQRKHGANNYGGTLQAVRRVLAEEGARGLFRGFGTSSLNLIVGQVYISVFEFLKSPHLHAADRPEALRTSMAASCAVLVSQAISNPIDVVSQRLMVERGEIRRPTAASTPSSTGSSTAPKAPPLPWAARVHPIRVVQDVLATHGVRGLYRGFFASILQHAPSSAIWWSSYTLYRRELLRWVRNRGAPQANMRPKPWMDRVSETLSGSLAGATVAVVANPLDVVRTRVQVEGVDVLATCRTLWLEDGARGFMRGLTARMLLLVPNGAIIMTAYELVKRLSHK